MSFWSCIFINPTHLLKKINCIIDPTYFFWALIKFVDQTSDTSDTFNGAGSSYATLSEAVMAETASSCSRQASTVSVAILSSSCCSSSILYYCCTVLSIRVSRVCRVMIDGYTQNTSWLQHPHPHAQHVDLLFLHQCFRLYYRSMNEQRVERENEREVTYLLVGKRYFQGKNSHHPVSLELIGVGKAIGVSKCVKFVSRGAIGSFAGAVSAVMSA